MFLDEIMKPENITYRCYICGQFKTWNVLDENTAPREVTLISRAGDKEISCDVEICPDCLGGKTK